MAPEKSASNSSFRKIPENFESPFGGLNGLRMSRSAVSEKCSFAQIGHRMQKLRPKQCSTPETLIAASEDPCFLQPR